MSPHISGRAPGVRGYLLRSSPLAAEEQLGDVKYLNLFTSLRARHAVGHHVQTKRAGRREGTRAGRERFLCTQSRDALLGRFVEPHSTAACTAAERFLPAARHFAILGVVSSADDRSCRINFAIDASQVTRVVQGDRLAVTAAVAQPPRADQFCEQRRVMLQFVVAAELRVFILERVVTMWAWCHDLLYVAAGKRLHVGLCALLEKELVADSARGIAGASLLFSEHGEVYSCVLEQVHRRTRDLLGARIEWRGATD